MSLWKKRHQPSAPAEAEEIAPEASEEEIEAQRRLERNAELAIELGDQYCSARACSNETGIACSYTDRRDHACPTAWCPEHRVVTHEAIYCRVHAAFVDGTEGAHGEMVHPDVETRAPALVNWVARELSEDIQGMIEEVAQSFSDDIVIDPVRFVLFDVDRVRTWDRSWKSCSQHGVNCRIAISVEEREPNVVLGKVNSETVIKLTPPWHVDHGIGEEPATEAEGEAANREFHQQLFLALARAVHSWEVEEVEAQAKQQTEPQMPSFWNPAPVISGDEVITYGAGSYGPAPSLDES